MPGQCLGFGRSRVLPCFAIKQIDPLEIGFTIAKFGQPCRRLIGSGADAIDIIKMCAGIGKVIERGQDPQEVDAISLRHLPNPGIKSAEHVRKIFEIIHNFSGLYREGAPLVTQREQRFDYCEV